MITQVLAITSTPGRAELKGGGTNVNYCERVLYSVTQGFIRIYGEGQMGNFCF